MERRNQEDVEVIKEEVEGRGGGGNEDEGERGRSTGASYDGLALNVPRHSIL